MYIMKIGIEVNLLKHLFKNVYFINGTAYAGKSTMVKMLAEKHDGIVCQENYNEKLFGLMELKHQPNLCYFQTMSGWQEFLNRTPEEYDAWIQNSALEGAELEIIELIRRTESGKKVFVDTNIPLHILHEISDYQHVAIMLSSTEMAVERFFDRADEEKQFLLSKIKEAKDPEATMQNFRACIARINSKEHYEAFEKSGFFVLKRDDSLTLEETMAVLEEHFGL